jgi:hypothetical protein
MRNLRLLLLPILTAACASGDTGGTADDVPVGPDACAVEPEVCNGVDDDCDERIDESFGALGTECTVGDGDCTAAGVYVCNDAADGVTCDATSGTPEDELCNGEDDDCDQATDEGFGLGDGCDGADSDACVEGLIVCDGAGAAICDDATAGTVETCNAVDDDCQHGADDGFPVGVECTVGTGACAATGAWECDEVGGVACSAVEGSPTAELCGDGIDQDCGGGDPTCPSNDRPSGAINISAGGTFTVDLAAAHNDHTVGTCGVVNGGGRDVYYRFTLPAAEVVYADTFGSTYDTVLRLYSGSCTGLDDQQVCADDICSGRQSQLAMQLPAGSYCLIVDQYYATETAGATVLNFTRGGRTGTAIAAGSGSRSGDTCGDADVTSPGCRTSTAGDEAYYFTTCPADSRLVDANTCTAGYDSVIYLRSGNAGNADVRCDDDSCGSLHSQFVDAPISGAGLHWLIVDGYQASCGTYTLSYSM